MSMTKFLKRIMHVTKILSDCSQSLSYFPNFLGIQDELAIKTETVSDTGSNNIVLVPHTAAFRNTFSACAEGKQLFDDGAFRDASKIHNFHQNTVGEPFQPSYLVAMKSFLNVFRIAFKLFCTIHLYLSISTYV